MALATSLKLAELVTGVLPLEDRERAFALVGSPDSIEVAITPGD